VIAVDDTMFRRSDRRMHAAHWGYDGSLKVPKSGKRLSRGNNFVAAAAVVDLPFLNRPIALPVLTQLWRKGRTDQDRAGPPPHHSDRRSRGRADRAAP
jgi:hypothetical protein